MNCYPAQFFVLQRQHSCTLCKQFHLDSRQRVCGGEVTLGPPAERHNRKRKTLEVSCHDSVVQPCAHQLSFLVVSRSEGLISPQLQCFKLFSDVFFFIKVKSISRASWEAYNRGKTTQCLCTRTLKSLFLITEDR